jgi:trigger factor
MPQVTRQDIDALNVVLTVSIPKEEFLPKIQKEIKKYSQQAQMKGFRKGKTPPQMVKSLYGHSMMMDLINKEIDNSLNEYLTESKLEMIGQPLASLDQEKISLNIDNPKDLEFKFDVGLFPKFELKGLEPVNVYTLYKAVPPSKQVDEALETARGRSKSSESVDGHVEEGDIVELAATEINGPNSNTFKTDVTEGMTDALKSLLLTKKKGDSFNWNILEIEKKGDEGFVKKYFLDLEEGNAITHEFQFEIVDIKRAQPAEFNEAFFVQQFGEESGIKTMDAAREEVAKFMSRDLDAQAKSLMLREVQKNLLVVNNFDLPETFIRRWIKERGERVLTDEEVENSYAGFVNSLKAQMVFGRVAEQENVRVTQDDLKAYYRSYLLDMIGGQFPLGEDFINDLTNRALSDKKQAAKLYDEAFSVKIMDAIAAKVVTKEEVIGYEELSAKMKAAQTEMSEEEVEAEEMENA